jgi:hypothetical protein
MLSFEADPTVAGDSVDTPEGSPVTPAFLETVWPTARPRLVTALRAAGVDEDAAADAVAEAATRALARGLVVDGVDGFCRWAFVVARNVVVDSGRKSQRVVLRDVMPESVDPYDLYRHVESRQRLREAGRVIASMPPGERGALLDTLLARDDEGGGEGEGDADGAGVASASRATTRQAAVALAVRRHRARARLRRAMGAPGGWLGGLGLRRPRWMWRLSRMPSDAVSAMIAMPLLAASVSWFVPPSAAAAVPPAAVAPVGSPRVAAGASAPSSSAASAPARSPKASAGAAVHTAGGTPPPPPPPADGPIKPAQGTAGVSLDSPTGDYARLELGFRANADDRPDGVPAVEVAQVAPVAPPR